jgi:hypothetical protein
MDPAIVLVKVFSFTYDRRVIIQLIKNYISLLQVNPFAKHWLNVTKGQHQAGKTSLHINSKLSFRTEFSYIIFST